MSINYEETKKEPKNPLKGAVNIAIEKAAQYGTPLVIKRDGQICEVTPAQMKTLAASVLTQNKSGTARSAREISSIAGVALSSRSATSQQGKTLAASVLGRDEKKGPRNK